VRLYITLETYTLGVAKPERVQAIYDRQAERYDAVAGAGRLETLRANLFARARGDVLELGVGTGATLAHYRNLSSLTGLDLSEKMLEKARARAVNLGFPVDLRQADFQTLPFADASFDTVSSSLGLCGIPDPKLLFSEIRRVLRPSGRLLALEHIRPPNAVLGLVADAINPVWDRIVGCHVNRPTLDLLERSGFKLTVLERHLAGALVSVIAEP
jgi:ubiquinone/menaquinone biosynthesis C-methylase UbiE